MRATTDLASDKACLLEDLHMLGCAGEAHREGPRELANRLFTEGEAGEHPSPRDVAQRMKDVIKLRIIFNHIVEYWTGRINCQPFG